jgi:tRNA nucleotidyltransferase (CCA-adding enzyme)
LKLPGAVRDLALLASRHANAIADAQALTPEGLLELMNSADAWRRPERFSDLLRAALADETQGAVTARRLESALDAAAAVDAGAIARNSSKPEAIREQLNSVRLQAIRAALSKP